MPDAIDNLLHQVGFTLEIEEQPFKADEFRQNIMKYFYAGAPSLAKL